MTEVPEKPTTRDQLAELLASGDIGAVRRETALMHSADLAEILDFLEEPEAKLRLYGLLGTEQASDVLRDASESTRDLILEHLSDTRIAEVIERLDTDDATDLVADLPEDRKHMILHRADPETRKELEDLLTYPDDSAGGIMKKEVAAVTVGSTVREIVDYIRDHADSFHDIHNVFVIDLRGHLVGVLPIRKLILAKPDTPVMQIMATDFVSVDVNVDQEEVARLVEKYDLLSLAVVDSLGRLVGRITVDDIVDVISEEATEDILALGGVSAEQAKAVGPLGTIRARFPWLGLNLVTATASAATISMFEHTIQTLAIAAAFMNIVASQGGSAGIQTMTTMVRSLALGEVTDRDTLRVLARECLTSAGNGLMLGLISGTIVYVWTHNVALSVVLGSALLMNLLISAVLGSLVPLTLRRLHVDPAVSSNVLVTAATDICGFFLFLGLLTLCV